MPLEKFEAGLHAQDYDLVLMDVHLPHMDGLDATRATRVLSRGRASPAFAILDRLGVPVAAPGQSCALGSTCVPCLDNKGFPAEFDRIWQLLLEPGRAAALERALPSGPLRATAAVRRNG